MKTNLGSDEPPKRLPPGSEIFQKELSDLFTTFTSTLFQILGVNETFLDKNPENWDNQETYNKAKDTLSGLRVTNYLAERGVVLMQSFNKGLVRTEEEKQYILQVVEYHRKNFPIP